MTFHLNCLPVYIVSQTEATCSLLQSLIDIVVGSCILSIKRKCVFCHYFGIFLSTFKKASVCVNETVCMFRPMMFASGKCKARIFLLVD